MIVKNSELVADVRENMRGGDGSVTLRKVPEGIMPGKWRLGAIIEIAPHSSIGLHTHEGECECFCFLDAMTVLDNGVESSVSAGDFMFTPDGNSHSVRNDGETPARMVAIIIQD